MLINKRKGVVLNHVKDYANNRGVLYENIDEYNPNVKCKMLIAFDNMIADMLSNRKLQPVVLELFIRGRKLNISLVFIINFILLYQKLLV